MMKRFDSIDWEQAKIDYITSNMPYCEIARKYGITASMVNKIGAKEGWVQAREAYCESVVQKTLEKTAQEQADKLASLKSSADKMGNIIDKILDSAEQFNLHQLYNGEVVKNEKVDTKAIRELTGAMKDLAAVIRDVYDIPTKKDNLAMEIAMQQIQSREEDTNESGIIMIPEVEELEEPSDE